MDLMAMCNYVSLDIYLKLVVVASVIQGLLE